MFESLIVACLLSTALSFFFWSFGSAHYEERLRSSLSSLHEELQMTQDLALLQEKDLFLGLAHEKGSWRVFRQANKQSPSVPASSRKLPGIADCRLLSLYGEILPRDSIWISFFSGKASSALFLEVISKASLKQASRSYFFSWQGERVEIFDELPSSRDCYAA